MWERIKGVFTDKQLAKTERWSSVPTNVTTMFTAIQVACLGAMLWVKSSSIGVLFPVVIAMLAPLRFGLVKFGLFKKEDMDILDED